MQTPGFVSGCREVEGLRQERVAHGRSEEATLRLSLLTPRLFLFGSFTQHVGHENK